MQVEGVMKKFYSEIDIWLLHNTAFIFSEKMENSPSRLHFREIFSANFA